MNNSIKKSLLLRCLSATVGGLLLLNAVNLSAQDGTAGDTVNQTTPNTNTQTDHNINQPNAFGDDATSEGSRASDGITSNRTTNRPGDDGDITNGRDMENRSALEQQQSDTGAGISGQSEIGTDAYDQQNQDSLAKTSNAQRGSITPGTSHAGQVVHLSSGQDQLQEVPVDALIDRKIANMQGKTLGEVEAVVRSQDGSPGLLVEAGGFMGIGEKEIVVPLNAVRLTGNQLIWETQLDAAQLKDLQEFHYDERRFSSVADD